MREERLASIIIPTWRDEEAVARTVQRLRCPPDLERIVAVALGEESRYQHVRERHPSLRWVSAPRGRASQMNAGAAVARARWLLFLHADSELPADWHDVIAQADGCADVVAGAFRLALDSTDWRARAIEMGVRIRMALVGLPYGDQALFARRSTFEAVGGYRDLPLMEDIDLVRRIRQRGRLLKARSAVLTSARRWERDGWVRRSARNIDLATRFLLGASPARLAQRYFDRRAAAVVMMTRAPWTGGKTRLRDAANESAHAELRRALFLDTLDVVTSVPQVEHIIACEPVDACERLRELVGSDVDVIAQRGGDLGDRMAHAFEDAFRLGMESVVLIGSDLPDLPTRLLHEALSALRGRRDRIVLGPAADGGYYLIGMNRLHPMLFDGIDWSTDSVLQQTLEAATAQDIPTALLDRWADVDRAEDLHRFIGGSPEGVAVRTRAWAVEHLAHS